MPTAIWLILLVLAFLVGVLVGRANPKKADRLAEAAKAAGETLNRKVR